MPSSPSPTWEGEPYKKRHLNPEQSNNKDHSQVIITEEEVSTTYETSSDANSNEYSDYYSPQLNCLNNK